MELSIQAVTVLAEDHLLINSDKIQIPTLRYNEKIYSKPVNITYDNATA